MSGQTPTPWRIKYGKRHAPDEADIKIAGDIFIIASVDGPNYSHCEANAAFIVKAVNAHEALVEKLEDAINRLHKCMTVNGTDEEFADLAVEPHRALLASLDEGEGGDGR